MNHKKIIIGLLVAVVVAVIVLFAVSAAKAKKLEEAKKTAANPAATGNTTTTTSPTPTAPAVLQVGYPIVYNKFNEYAKILQRTLGMQGKDVDGIVGKKTLLLWNETIAPNHPYTSGFEIRSRGELDYAINEIVTAKAAKAAIKATGNSWWNTVDTTKWAV